MLDMYESLPNSSKFPINRRHQGLATVDAVGGRIEVPAGFQSIGVTKDWRRSKPQAGKAPTPRGFQSIGVTKDWRHESVDPRSFDGLRKVSNQ